MSVTEAESRVVKDFEEAGVQIDYKVSGAKEDTRASLREKFRSK